jgi:tetratricopeptide (TPR) repeat protein
VTLPQVPLSYVGYLKKALWPAGLAIFYPHPGHALPLGRSLAAAAALAVLTGAALWQWRRRPWLPLGWLWYLVVLVPMVGVVQVGSQAMADRYSYLPLIGVFILLTWGASEGLARVRHPRWAGPVAAVLVLSLLAGLTFRQAGFWRDDRALFTHALAVTGDGNPVAHNILGKVALDAGDMAGAAAHYQAALAVQPLSPSSLFNGAVALSAIGRREEAIALFVQYAQLRPRNVEVRYNLGVLYADAGRLAEAEKMLREALALAPGHPQALAQLKRLQR